MIFMSELVSLRDVSLDGFTGIYYNDFRDLLTSIRVNPIGEVPLLKGSYFCGKVSDRELRYDLKLRNTNPTNSIKVYFSRGENVSVEDSNLLVNGNYRGNIYNIIFEDLANTIKFNVGDQRMRSGGFGGNLNFL